MKKYILKKKRLKFKKRLSLETKRYYNTLHKVNKLGLKKVLKEKPRPKAPVRPEIQLLLIWAIYFFLINLVVFLQNNFGWFR